MLNTEDYRKAKERQKPCPHGRRRRVGSTECENCTFHRIEDIGDFKIREARCEGTHVSVSQHRKIFKRIINALNKESNE
ncbi:MAG: hypothetical protein J6I49_03460 [Bacteroidales bacterium]|nr:hypothetical protein [Bacteroidales bacterium]